jgi:hypothetical protein
MDLVNSAQLSDSDKVRLLQTAKLCKDSATLFRQRRHSDWTENYTLGRDKVEINRLLQRQSVNIPLMKYSIQTVLKDIDDPPMLYFTNRDNDAQKEVFYNEYWKYCWTEGKGIVKDIVDKKQVLYFGRSFKKLNIASGRFDYEIIDPHDMLVNQYVDPANLDSARDIHQEHIFVPLSSLSKNEAYDQAAITRIKEKTAVALGLMADEASAGVDSLADKNERLEALGVIDAMNPQLGETYIELNEHYIKVWDEASKRDVIMYIVSCEGSEVLLCKRLDEVLGKTKDDYWIDHFPYDSWGSDMERTDFWSDGVADSLRTPNKVLNSWFSQLIENRTMRSFGMTYFNSTIDPDFQPQTFEPEAFGWYPIPGDPNSLLKPVDIPALTDSLSEIQFVMDLAERASAATSMAQGSTQGHTANVTLGEIQLALSNATERIKSMSVLYTNSWENFGTKYIKLLEGSADKIDAVTLYKKGKNTKHIYSKVIGPADWETESGWVTEVRDLSSATGAATDTLNKLNAAIGVMPNNAPLKDIFKQKVIEFAGLSATEVKDVMEAEKSAQAATTVTPPVTPAPTLPTGPETPLAGMKGPAAAPVQQVPVKPITAPGR